MNREEQIRKGFERAKEREETERKNINKGKVGNPYGVKNAEELIDFVALEVEGGVWTGGRHTSPKGFLGDMEKYNTATIMVGKSSEQRPTTCVRIRR